MQPKDKQKVKHEDPKLILKPRHVMNRQGAQLAKWLRENGVSRDGVKRFFDDEEFKEGVIENLKNYEWFLKIKERALQENARAYFIPSLLYDHSISCEKLIEFSQLNSTRLTVFECEEALKNLMKFKDFSVRFGLHNEPAVLISWKYGQDFREAANWGNASDIKRSNINVLLTLSQNIVKGHVTLDPRIFHNKSFYIFETTGDHENMNFIENVYGSSYFLKENPKLVSLIPFSKEQITGKEGQWFLFKMKKQEKPKIVVIGVNGLFLKKNENLPKEEKVSFEGIINSVHSVKHLAFAFFEEKNSMPRIEVSLENIDTSFCNILRGLFPNVKIDENGDDFIDFVLEGVTKNQFIKILESKFQVELKTFPGKG